MASVTPLNQSKNTIRITNRSSPGTLSRLDPPPVLGLGLGVVCVLPSTDRDGESDRQARVRWVEGEGTLLGEDASTLGDSWTVGSSDGDCVVDKEG